MARPDPPQVTASYWEPGLLEGWYHMYHTCPHCSLVHITEVSPSTEYSRVRTKCPTTKATTLVVTPNALREDAR